MRMMTWGDNNTPVAVFADEPETAQAIARHTIYGGPVNAVFAIIRHETHGLAVLFECQLGDAEPFSRFFTLSGNEFVVDAMIEHRVLVLLPTTPDVPGSKVEGLPLPLDDNDVANLRRLRWDM